MEESNGLERSEVWHKIHDIVKQIPRKEVNCDAVDAPSAATMIEELFLKLLPIHDVSNRRELLFAFIKDWKEEFKDENWDYLDFMAERFLSKQ